MAAIIASRAWPAPTVMLFTLGRMLFTPLSLTLSPEGRGDDRVHPMLK